jgi:hypothetical protein
VPTLILAKFDHLMASKVEGIASSEATPAGNHLAVERRAGPDAGRGSEASVAGRHCSACLSALKSALSASRAARLSEPDSLDSFALPSSTPTHRTVAPPSPRSRPTRSNISTSASSVQNMAYLLNAQLQRATARRCSRHQKCSSIHNARPLYAESALNIKITAARYSPFRAVA